MLTKKRKAEAEEYSEEESEEDYDSEENEKVEIKKPKVERLDKMKNLKKIIINVSMTQYSVVSEAAEDLGWKVQYSTDKGDWDVFWTDFHIEPDVLIKMHLFQKINHYPGIHTLARKNLLGVNLMSMRDFFEEEYNFFPLTWMLPQQYVEFRTYFENKPKGKARTYIVKPEADCQGRGIFLTRKLDSIENGKHYVVQRYMARPYLIDGLKFDMRIYVLLGSVNPLRIYIYEEGLARFATEPYIEPTNSNLEKQYMHLTNYAINKRNPKFIFNNNSANMGYGHKRSLTCIYKQMEKKGININLVKSKIKDLIVKTIITGLPLMSHQYRCSQPEDYTGNMCFHILGFDVMLKNDLEPVLIEVNHTPSFAADTPLDFKIKKNLIKDTLRLMNVNLTKKADLYERSVEISQARLLTGKRNILEGAERDELIQKEQKEREEYESQKGVLGGFEVIYPLKEECEEQKQKQQEEEKESLESHLQQKVVIKKCNRKYSKNKKAKELTKTESTKIEEPNILEKLEKEEPLGLSSSVVDNEMKKGGENNLVNGCCENNEINRSNNNNHKDKGKDKCIEMSEKTGSELEKDEKEEIEEIHEVKKPESRMTVYRKLIEHAMIQQFDENAIQRNKLAEKEAKRLAREEYRELKKAKKERKEQNKKSEKNVIQPQQEAEGEPSETEDPKTAHNTNAEALESISPSPALTSHQPLRSLSSLSPSKSKSKSKHDKDSTVAMGPIIEREYKSPEVFSSSKEKHYSSPSPSSASLLFEVPVKPELLPNIHQNKSSRETTENWRNMSPSPERQDSEYHNRNSHVQNRNSENLMNEEYQQPSLEMSLNTIIAKKSVNNHKNTSKKKEPNLFAILRKSNNLVSNPANNVYTNEGRVEASIDHDNLAEAEAGMLMLKSSSIAVKKKNDLENQPSQPHQPQYNFKKESNLHNPRSSHSSKQIDAQVIEPTTLQYSEEQSEAKMAGTEVKRYTKGEEISQTAEIVGGRTGPVVENKRKLTTISSLSKNRHPNLTPYSTSNYESPIYQEQRCNQNSMSSNLSGIMARKQKRQHDYQFDQQQQWRNSGSVLAAELTSTTATGTVNSTKQKENGRAISLFINGPNNAQKLLSGTPSITGKHQHRGGPGSSSLSLSSSTTAKGKSGKFGYEGYNHSLSSQGRNHSHSHHAKGRHQHKASHKNHALHNRQQLGIMGDGVLPKASDSLTYGYPPKQDGGGEFLMPKIYCVNFCEKGGPIKIGTGIGMITGERDKVNNSSIINSNNRQSPSKDELEQLQFLNYKKKVQSATEKKSSQSQWQE